MIVIKNKVKADGGMLHIKLPEEFKNKVVEVIVKVDTEITKKLLIDSIKIDTTKWEFNREEIYGR